MFKHDVGTAWLGNYLRAILGGAAARFGAESISPSFCQKNEKYFVMIGFAEFFMRGRMHHMWCDTSCHIMAALDVRTG